MDLPNLLNKLKSTPEEEKKFVAIEIGYDVVKTAIWQSTGVHTEVLSVGSNQTWQTTQTDDLVTAIDTSLADAQASITEEPDQVIFGLCESWADDNGIVDAKKPILKDICKRLGLKAIGFVITTEAMVHHLRDVEGSPPSCILLQVATDAVAVSLVYLGKLEATKIVGRSTTIATDVEEGLARIPHTGHLPSRMILLTNLDEPEPIRQDLISYDWQKQLEFLHFPKIESLSKDWSIKAIAVAGGSEVVESLGFSNLTQTESEKPEKKPKLEPDPIVAETIESSPTPSTENETFGFKPVQLEPQKELETPTVPEPEPMTISETPVEDDEEVIENIEAVPEPLSTLPVPTSSLWKLPPKRILIPLLIAISVVFLVGASIAAYTIFPQATVDVYVGMTPYQQQLIFTVDPQATDTDLQSLVVPGKKSTIEKSGTKSIATTGTKTIGERAKGKVTLYNRTTASKNLPAGTVIKNGNFRYTLDTSVTIASASTKENTDFSLTTAPSKADVAVTAADIGDQYNVAKDTQFSIANFSNDSFVAVAVSGFSGGSARKVAAVASEDIDMISSSLIEELRKDIDTTMSQTGEATRQVSVGEPTLSQKKYSANKGEEASQLSLDVTLTQTIYQYDASIVSLLAQQVAQNALPKNVQLKPDSTKINAISTALTDDGKAKITAQVILQYIPIIETDQYSKALTNVPIKTIDTKLNSIPNYQRASVQSKYVLFGRLPMNAKKVVLHIRPVAKTE